MTPTNARPIDEELPNKLPCMAVQAHGRLPPDVIETADCPRGGFQ